jgi:polygalacturonase
MALTKVTYSMINGAPVNVADYGAVGDGTTDDTAAIQAAINYASSLNGYIETIFAPGKTYLVGGLVPKAGVSINLQGSTIKLKAAGNVPIFFDGGSGVGGSNFDVSNGTLDCNQANNADINVVGGVWLSNWTNLVFDNLTIINCSRSGLNLIGVQHVKIRNYQFLNCGKVGAFFAYGITLEKYSTTRSRYVDIDGFVGNNVRGFGIHFFECDDFVAKNLSFNTFNFGAVSIAITVTEALRGEISNVQCTNVSGDNIEINDSTDITITNCNVVSAGNRALLLGANAPGNVNTRIIVTNFSCTGTVGAVSAAISSCLYSIFTNLNFDKGVNTTVAGPETGNVVRNSVIATSVGTAGALLLNQFTLENVKFSDVTYKYFGSRTGSVVLTTTLASAAVYNIDMATIFSSKLSLTNSVGGRLDTISAFTGSPATQGSYQTCNFLVNNAGTAANLSAVTQVNSAVARALTITGDAANKRLVLTNGSGVELSVTAELNVVFPF